MRDVAARAGVSIKTISRVINNDPGVAPATADRVRDAISELGFHPNPAARSLRVGQDNAVGVVVENVADPYMAAMTGAIERAAHERGLFVLVASSGYAPENERPTVLGLVNRRVAGLILTPTSGDHSYLADRGGLPYAVPVVSVDRPAVRLDCDTVLIDNESAARTATEHLLARGHRRIGFVGDRLSVYTTALRYQGYRAAHCEAGVPVDESFVRISPVADDDIDIHVTALIEPPAAVSAILSSNARSSLATVRALHRAGRTDVAHVSFDDFDGAESMSPPVTVVYQDPSLMGRRAAELLFDRIDGERAPARHVVLPTELIARGSGELLP
jgi:LacI family transcriptional regulator